MRSKTQTNKYFNSLFSKLSLIFIFFLLIAIVFGFIYYYTYRNDPTSFLVAKPFVQKRALNEQIKQLIDLQQNLNENISFLRKKVHDLNERKTEDQISVEEVKSLMRRYLQTDTSVFLASNWNPMSFPYFEIKIDTLRTFQMIQPHFIKYVTRPRYQKMKRKDGTDEWVEYYPLITTYEDILDELIDREKEVNNRMTQAKNYIEENYIAKLDLADFMYFSISTITTLGFGDIAPNSTIIRWFAICEVLLGLFVAMVVINTIVSASKK